MMSLRMFVALIAVFMVAAFPAMADIHSAAGESWEKVSKELWKAVDDFEKSEEWIRCRASKFEEALSPSEDPRSAAAHNGLGFARMKLSDLEQAALG